MKKALALSFLAGLALASGALAQNGGVSLNDAPARYRVIDGVSDIPTGAEPGGGVSADFQVQTTNSDSNANADHLFANWWWYRVNGPAGTTRELAVRQNAGNAVRTLSGTNGVSYAFSTQNGLNFTVSYTAVSISSTVAEVRCVLTVQNLITAAPSVDVSLFNHVDYFLAGQDANDFAAFSLNGSNRVITVTDPLRPWATMTHTGFGATAHQVGGWSAITDMVTNVGINNANNSVLNPAGASGDDIAGLMQWDLNIGSGQSQSVTSLIRVTIPTPGAAALVGLGGLAVLRRRR